MVMLALAFYTSMLLLGIAVTAWCCYMDYKWSGEWISEIGESNE